MATFSYEAANDVIQLAQPPCTGIYGYYAIVVRAVMKSISMHKHYQRPFPRFFVHLIAFMCLIKFIHCLIKFIRNIEAVLKNVIFGNW